MNIPLNVRASISARLIFGFYAGPDSAGIILHRIAFLVLNEVYMKSPVQIVLNNHNALAIKYKEMQRKYLTLFTYFHNMMMQGECVCSDKTCYYCEGKRVMRDIGMEVFKR